MKEALRTQSPANTETKEKGDLFGMPSSDAPGTAFPVEKTESGEEKGKIKNRDIPLIWELRDTKEEILRLEDERDWLHDRMYSITRSLTGMPGGGGARGGFENMMARIADSEEQYFELMRMYAKRAAEAERIIRNIESSSMRLFVRMYYRDHADKKTVMEKMRMKEWGFRRARESIEGAACMADVTWRERFILEKDN